MYSLDIILSVQNYIQNNLTDILTLDGIAEQVHFSPYWLSRLYHRETGETVMEYVRKQRLRRAAYELLNTGCDILEVALKFGYDSSDGFSRAFKMHYGMTPMKYKQSGKLIETDLNANKLSEEKVVMYKYWMYEKMNCSKDEKQAMIPFIDKLLQLSNKAKQFGLFRLEDEESIVSEPLLKKGIELMVDGTKPEILKKILLNYLICENKQAKEFLKGILIIESILYIQQGYNPNIIKEILLSYLGEEMIEDIENYYSNNQSKINLIKNYIAALSQDEIIISTNSIEGPFEKISDRSLQRLLREIDYEIIAIALKGSNKKTQEKTLNNLSPRLAVVIIEYMKSMTTVLSSDINEAQKSITEIMKLMIQQGEIVI